MKFIELHISYPIPHAVYISPDFITAVEENRINENSRGSIVHMGESSFIIEETQQDVITMMLEHGKKVV